MAVTLALHIVAGTLSLVAGYVALFSTKGATVHRKSGILFVYAMLAMAFFGALIAAVRSVAPAVNVPMALFTSYLVVTSLATVLGSRLSALGSRRTTIGLMVFGAAVASMYLVFGVQVLAGAKRGMPAAPFLVFGAIALLAVAGDLRVIRFGALTGKPRLSRHLWRMSFALFIAALSFSVQAAKILARNDVRVPGVAVALPMLVVLVTMFYWLWRVRRKGVNVERWTIASPSPSSPASLAATQP